MYEYGFEIGYLKQQQQFSVNIIYDKIWLPINKQGKTFINMIHTLSVRILIQRIITSTARNDGTITATIIQPVCNPGLSEMCNMNKHRSRRNTHKIC